MLRCFLMFRFILFCSWYSRCFPCFIFLLLHCYLFHSIIWFCKVFTECIVEREVRPVSLLVNCFDLLQEQTTTRPMESSNLNICIFVWVDTCVYMYVCMYIYIHIYIYLHTVVLQYPRMIDEITKANLYVTTCVSLDITTDHFHATAISGG